GANQGEAAGEDAQPGGVRRYPHLDPPLPASIHRTDFVDNGIRAPFYDPSVWIWREGFSPVRLKSTSQQL
ncbi:hypothetical protein, partial [Effusibacillus pohliae]